MNLKKIAIAIVLTLLFSCSSEEKIPTELSNKKWIDITKYQSKYYKRCGKFERNIITTKNTIQVELMEATTFEISRIVTTDGGYQIFTINSENEKENDWHYNFRWIDKSKKVAIWEYISAKGKTEEGFTYTTIENNFFINLKLNDPPCEACMTIKECDSIKKIENKNVYIDSISKLNIDEKWIKDYNVWLESYNESYNYNYLIKISKDSSYISERSIKDMLIPYQIKDTLFLYHKKSLLEDYAKNKLEPEVKIVKIKNQYFVSSQIFDLKNSISNKPTKYGFLVDEVN
ncbi:hypothetical protein [Flavobacterium polysaccharolyticum]|uniref:Lipoprotein n=1 Tax=Flavobacterium polysaccharolyticum TaxID=3133148 RepID=A0ABU9NIH8_9FLAO